MAINSNTILKNRCLWSITILLAGSILFLGVFSAGVYYGRSAVKQTQVDRLQVLLQNLATQRASLTELTQTTDGELNALALRLGQLQSQMMRLNAVGQRVVEKLDFDGDEFNFSELPPVGGLAHEDEATGQDIGAMEIQLQQLTVQVLHRQMQLKALEGFISTRSLKQEAMPKGRPVLQGWLSSKYGLRADPFSGRRAFHTGIDFAAKPGSAIVAVASGLVTVAGNWPGYGNLVEIDHGGGYVTRYAHSRDVMASVGDKVKQGDPIARIGSTGRSTGPHVHFEVLHNGKKIDPMGFISETPANIAINRLGTRKE